MSNFQLTKSSSESDLKRYFTAVLELSKSDNQFPINLDEVWMLVYERKDKAFKTLRTHFFEGEDFYLTQMGKVVTFNELQNGVKTECFLSVSCMEYFIARKVRPVFEVYRQVFHKTATTPMLPQNYKQALTQLLAQVDRNERLALENKALQEDARDKQRTIEQQCATISLQENEIKESAPKAQYYDAVLQSSSTYTSTVMAKELGLRHAEQLHKELERRQVMFHACGQWVLQARYCQKDYTRTRTHTYIRHDGTHGTNTITVWTEAGRVFLHNLFNV